MLKFINENALEDYLHGEMSNGYNPIDDTDVYKCWRQVALGDYGIADLVCASNASGFLSLNVIELKNEPFTAANFSQIARYKTYFDHQGDESIDITYTLVAPKSEITDKIYLYCQCDWIDMYFYDLSPSVGINFEYVSKGWHRSSSDSIFYDEVKADADIVANEFHMLMESLKDNDDREVKSED